MKAVQSQFVSKTWLEIAAEILTNYWVSAWSLLFKSVQPLSGSIIKPVLWDNNISATPILQGCLNVFLTLPQHVCCLLVLNPCKRNVLNLAIIPILAIKAVFTVFAMIVYNSDLLTLLTYRPHSSRGMRTQKSSRPVSLQAGLDWSQAPRQAHLVLQAPYITWKSDWFFGTGVSRSVLISKKNLQAFKWQSGAPLKLSFDHFNSLSVWSSICGANMESHMAPKMSVFGRIFWTESPCSVCAVDLGVDGAVVVPQAEDSGGRKRLIKKLI